MAPIYPKLSSNEGEGNLNEGFEPDLEPTKGNDDEATTDFQNDLSDPANLRPKFDTDRSSYRSSRRESNISSNQRQKRGSIDNESNKSNPYGRVVPDSLTSSSKQVHEESDQIATVSKYKSAQIKFHKNYVQPFIYKYNVPPPNPSFWEKFKYAVSCPPHGNIESALTWLVSLFFFWACLVYIIFGEALPGGNVFSIIILAVVAQIVSMIMGLVQIPPLLGMLLTGIVFKSVPGINVIGNSVDPAWAANLKSVALVVILIRAGLGLDPKALKKLSFVVARLACTPCLCEAFIDAVISHYLLGFPWKWAFIQGFVIAAISPAVVVPCLLNLSARGYGNSKGIPTLLIAGASIDDVVTITGFGIAVGLTFATGSTVWQGVKGPIAALMGVAYGIVVGVLLWYVPSKNNPNCKIFRSILILLAGMLVIFGSKGINYSGAGAIGCLVTTFVASIGHRNKPSTQTDGMAVNVFFNHLWTVLAPIIFSLIGTEIDVTNLDPNTLLWGAVTIIIGLVCRVAIAFSVVFGAGFTIKERIFIAIAWIPKATVQAAIGATALDYARAANTNPDIVTEDEIMGQKILTVAVLAILLAAPIGAAATMISGPILLKDTLEKPPEDEENANEKEASTKQSPEDNDKQSIELTAK